MSKSNSGLIFNIQRFSVHDGPGIRDVVFTKGCSLRCLWCSNPESQNSYPEIAYIEERCIGHNDCGRCKAICSEAAIILEREKVAIDRKLCTNCGKCAEVCPSKAIRVFGQYMTDQDVMRVVEEDSPFYWRSGGGVTVSGGEPLVQADFVRDLLKHCRGHGTDTAIEITGHAPWENTREVCRYANLIYYDIKEMDAGRHKAFTGVANDLVLENIKSLAHSFPETPIIARTPVVPGLNDSEENIRAIARFLAGIDTVKRYELLPYHGFGEPKYKQLGREYSLGSLRPLSQERMVALRKVAQGCDIQCSCG